MYVTPEDEKPNHRLLKATACWGKEGCNKRFTTALSGSHCRTQCKVEPSFNMNYTASVWMLILFLVLLTVYWLVGLLLQSLLQQLYAATECLSVQMEPPAVKPKTGSGDAVQCQRYTITDLSIINMFKVKMLMLILLLLRLWINKKSSSGWWWYFMLLWYDVNRLCAARISYTAALKGAHVMLNTPNVFPCPPKKCCPCGTNFLPGEEQNGRTRKVRLLLKIPISFALSPLSSI